tara:strand:- start:10627 stop:11580 length:954 start_codon:yes stop_codon:yes gene_type:complete
LNKIKKNKFSKFKRGLIVGPSGIGRVHFRRYYKSGIREIAVIGKRFNKNRSFPINSTKKNGLKILNLKNFNNIKKFKPELVSICSPFEKHLEHILKCNHYCKYIIVEKPFIWFNNSKRINVYKIASIILSKFGNKIMVNLPMVSLAKQLSKKKEIPKKIRVFKFMYFTKGKQIYENIAVDLLPHAISFILAVNGNLLRNFEIKSVKVKKFKWSCKIIINNVICYFLFTQDKKRKESNLFFKLNKNHYRRKQELVNGEYINTLIRNNKKKINIKNPMTEYLNLLIKNTKNTKNTELNHNLVLVITKLTKSLLTWKNKN